YLFEYADEHNFQPKRPEIAFFETDTLHIRQSLTFDQIAEVTGVEKEMLQFLNPAYKLDIIPYVKEESYALRLPRSNVGLFVNNEDKIYDFARKEIVEKEKDLPRFVEAQEKIRYRVKSGDILGKIAQKYGVGVTSIKNWNNLKNNDLRIGQYLTLYPTKTVSLTEAAPARNTTSPPSKQYTVKKGDSLWSISKKFPGITVQNLKSWNEISNSNLQPGMVLRISK